MNTGTVPKYDGMANHGSIPKHGYSQNNQNKYDNRKRYNNQKKYNYNKQDSYNKYDSYNKPESYNGNTYSKHDNYNKYNNYNKNDNYNKRDNQNKQTQHQNRYDSQNRYESQTKRDNHNRYDSQDRHDTRSRQDIQDRQDFQSNRDIQSRMRNIQSKSRSQSVQLHHDPIIAHTWRVVCDSMLGGLSNRLRMCGVDCVHVLFDEGGNESATLAMVEHRFLLTRHRNYQKVSYKLYHYSSCYNFILTIITITHLVREICTIGEMLQGNGGYTRKTAMRSFQAF